MNDCDGKAKGIGVEWERLALAYNYCSCLLLRTYYNEETEKRRYRYNKTDEYTTASDHCESKVAKQVSG